jgi:hypothetical protein
MFGAEHVPHGTMPPHPSGAVPQFCAPQASPGVLGVQMQSPLAQVAGAVQAVLSTQLPLSSHVCGLA